MEWNGITQFVANETEEMPIRHKEILQDRSLNSMRAVVEGKAEKVYKRQNVC